jgi:hypothetical protein
MPDGGTWRSAVGHRRCQIKKGPDLAKWIMVNLGGRGGGRRKRDNSHEFIRHLGVFLALALFGFW